MKIKKLSEKDKNKDQEALFNVKSLEKDKENRPSFKTSVEDQEKIEKEFKKNSDKVEKFESFIDIHIDNIENLEIKHDEDNFDADYEESETSGCGCCSDCTGEEGCYCGCDDCKCDTDENVKKASEFVNVLFSESLKYHLPII